MFPPVFTIATFNGYIYLKPLILQQIQKSYVLLVNRIKITQLKAIFENEVLRKNAYLFFYT